MKKKNNTNNAKVMLGIGIAGIALCLAILAFLWSSQGKTSTIVSQSANNPVLSGDAQVLRMAVTSNGYEPATLKAEPGKPIRLIVDGSKATGCYRSIVSRQMGFNKILNSGDNEIDIPALTTGTYPFSCSMGMIRGNIVVGDSVVPAQNAPTGGSCGSGGCGCGARA